MRVPHAAEMMRPWLMSALAVCAGAAAALPVCARTQSLPAGVRACAREQDASRRLACYDREVARYSPPRGQTVAAPGTDSAPSTNGQAGTHPSASAPESVSPKPPRSQRPPVTARLASALERVAGSGADRITAHIVAVQRVPGALVLRLDNGQVWRQTGRASGDLTLRAGDRVTIDRHLGDYWLSSRHVYAMRVRREPQ